MNNELKRLLDLNKISQKQLADRLGFRPNNFNMKLAKGKYDSAFFEKIAIELNVPANYFEQFFNNSIVRDETASLYERIIAEKDKRIEALEKLLEAYTHFNHA